MNVSEVLVDAFGRVHEVTHDVLRGLGDAQLSIRPDAGGNSIGWLIWHLLRVQDDHVADAAGYDQVWIADGWAERFGLPYPDHDTGYAHSADEVGQLRTSVELLAGYLDALHAKTTEYVGGLQPDGLDRVVDTNWTPHVTLGVRLISVIADDLEHAGQAAFLRGVIERGGPG